LCSTGSGVDYLSFQFYLALYAGPFARTSGFSAILDVETGRVDGLIEVAFPPYAYVMTVDSEDDRAFPTANITGFVDTAYNQRADVEIELLIGFGHTRCLPTTARRQ
jgi:hypothetical protein